MDQRGGVLGVPKRVRERLLDDAVGRHVESGRQRPGLAVDLQVHRQTRRPNTVQERRELAQARLGSDASGLVRIAERTDESAELRHRLPTRRLNCRQRRLRLARG